LSGAVVAALLEILAGHLKADISVVSGLIDGVLLPGYRLAKDPILGLMTRQEGCLISDPSDAFLERCQTVGDDAPLRPSGFALDV
jgi:hypothetical protein